MSKNVGFVSTRFAGIDGVSLESEKWAEVLENGGYKCFWFAGELNKDPETSFLVPQAHFKHPNILRINEQVFGKKRKTSSVTNSIKSLSTILKSRLQEFVNNFNLDLLIIENALAIPLNIPLGIGLSELISETQIPTIAHHHDFSWERRRFHVNAAYEYLNMYFPPNLPSIKHVVINSAACEEMARRKKISTTVIPNVLDFDNPPCWNSDDYGKFLSLFRLCPNDKTILQPTRIIKRKGIERAVELVKTLNGSHYKLLISHEAGDEGFEYAAWIKNFAHQNGVDLRFPRRHVSSPWERHKNNSNGFSLWDVYAHADFVTFPSTYEGFGNAFLEAIYYKKPILVNRYSTFIKDIEPKGFDLITIDGDLTSQVVHNVREILESPKRRKSMVDHNYEIAKRHYSYEILQQQLNIIINDIFTHRGSLNSSMVDLGPHPDGYINKKSNVSRLSA
jgi:glycosyltransferase involved in cell wall biosynthesis